MFSTKTVFPLQVIPPPRARRMSSVPRNPLSRGRRHIVHHTWCLRQKPFRLRQRRVRVLVRKPPQLDPRRRASLAVKLPRASHAHSPRTGDRRRASLRLHPSTVERRWSTLRAAENKPGAHGSHGPHCSNNVIVFNVRNAQRRRFMVARVQARVLLHGGRCARLCPKRLGRESKREKGRRRGRGRDRKRGVRHIGRKRGAPVLCRVV